MKQARFLYPCLSAAFVLSAIFTISPLAAEDSPSAETGSPPEAMAYGRFVPEREDDFTWENDKVAFRIYGPASNGKGQVSGVDAWLKKVPWPIVDKFHVAPCSSGSRSWRKSATVLPDFDINQ